MKAFYKWFDIFLNLLLLIPIFSFTLLPYIAENNTSYGMLFDNLEFLFSLLIFISVFFSLIYILLGISLLLVNLKKEKKKKNPEAKIILLKGIIRLIIPYIFFYLGSALGLFGLALSGSRMPML
jgi:hypothetical protein